MSSKWIAESRWPTELSATTREGAPASSAGASRPARRKCPRWLVANWSSQPSRVRASGHAMMPALLTRMWSGAPVARKRSAKRRTLSTSARSRSSTRTAGFRVEAWTSRATASPLARSRTARITRAPAAASARAVSTPMPDAAPVTMAFFPSRSIPATTSIAVDPCPKRDVTRSAIAPPPAVGPARVIPVPLVRQWPAGSGRSPERLSRLNGDDGGDRVPFEPGTGNGLQESVRHPAIQREELVVAESGAAVKQSCIVGRPVDERVLAVVVSEDVAVVGDDESADLPLVVGVDQLAYRVHHAVVETDVDHGGHRAALAADHEPRPALHDAAEEPAAPLDHGRRRSAPIAVGRQPVQIPEEGIARPLAVLAHLRAGHEAGERHPRVGLERRAEPFHVSWTEIGDELVMAGHLHHELHGVVG